MGLVSKQGAGVARRRRPLFSTSVLRDSLLKLNPVSLASNPVMLIVELTFFVVGAMAVYPQAFVPVASPGKRPFYVEVALILLITVWFSTLSDSLAEHQARNTASSLRRLETEVVSKKIIKEEWTTNIVPTKSTDLQKGDLVLLEMGDTVPIDADVIEGIAMVDESLLTGESAPVRKAPGDTLIGGSMLLSDTLTAKVSVNPGETFIDQMIKMVESSKRPKTPNEQAVTVVLLGLTAIFSIIIIALLGLSVTLGLGADLSVLIALYVCLLPTTIGALLPAIGLSGMSRLYKNRIVAKSGKAIETAGDVDVILLDKTGTITVGNRRAIEFIPFGGHTEREVGEASFLSSWYDDTPEGRSIIDLAYESGFTPKELNTLEPSRVYEFSAATRTSGVKINRGTALSLPKGLEAGRERGRFRRKMPGVFEDWNESEPEIEVLKGAPDSMKERLSSVPTNFDELVNRVSAAGETPIVVSRSGDALGIIRLKDVLKEGIREKIQAVKAMDIRPVMITGDQPLTAKSIAEEVGIDEYVPRARPEMKFGIVKREQAESRIVAMIGDGTNDAPALAVADVGLAMGSGTEAAKEAANMVDLESNPAKVIEVVMLGKQLLMTRGAVTAFSIANDVAKYFAIVPVLFAATMYAAPLHSLNILHLGLDSAVLSALIFNAIIIPLLIPIAMRGVTFKPTDTMSIFLRNVLIYGVGGVVVPFVGIKLIDILISVI
ncbi:MAG: HAD-IC family P-type ATPase [Nitrososphaerales archaeon]